MVDDKNNKEFIKKSTINGIAIIITLTTVIFLIFDGSTEVLALFSVIAFIAMFIFLILYIPKAQQIHITDMALVINGYNNHRSIFWYQIYDVYLDEQNKNKVVIKISKNIKDDHREIIPYIDLPIDAQAFGVNPKELFNEIKKKIQ